MSRARTLLGSTIVLALAAALTACGGGESGEIYIGIAGPVGLANGKSMKLAAEMAVDEINRAGGIDGHTLALVIKDDQANAELAVDVATELRDDPRVVAVVGHINSSASSAAAREYNHPDRGVVEISPASSSPKLSEAGEWTFRVCPTDLQHAPALADWAYQQLGKRRAAVLYANDDYGRGLVQAFQEAFEADGGEVVSRDPFLPSIMETADALDPFLERALRDHMDALVIAGQAEEGLKIIRAARRLGYRGEVLGADGLTSLATLPEAGRFAEGVYITSAFLPDRPTDEARKFVDAYVARYGELPDHRGAMTYDAIGLIARALVDLDAAGTTSAEPSMGETVVLRRAIRDYLATVGTRSPPYVGVSGTIRFDANGDVAGKEVAVGIVRGGQIVTASS